MFPHPAIEHLMANLDRERLGVEIRLDPLSEDEVDMMLRAIFQHITGQVVVMPLYYDATPSIIGNRLVNVFPAYFGNAHEWDLK